MTYHIAPDLDRIALSAELWGLATRYTIEATLAEIAEDAKRLSANARQLAELARGVLHAADIERADGYARAAALDIERVEASRRASWAIYESQTVLLRCSADGRHTPHPWTQVLPSGYQRACLCGGV